MYSLFRAKALEWNNALVQAVIQQRPDYRPYWWGGEPIQPPVPEFTFEIDPSYPAPDNYWTGTEFDLYSPRLIDLLQASGISFETFPAKFIDSRTGEATSLPHRVFHLLERWPAFNLEESRIELPEIVSFVILKQRLEEPKLLFRAAELDSRVLIHDALKEKLINARITGCTFMPVESYVGGIEELRLIILGTAADE